MDVKKIDPKDLQKGLEGRYICAKCNVPLELKNTSFSYLGHPFHADILRCPVCGNVLIDEKLARGRMAEVEAMLEDK